ncbi:ankyrin repeat-containing protein NPR4-like isoform X2 [Salvia hispanica]|uniref:ankyrin repeat-containing protein NPR4-like isoform X2 n=1 Tax=Salvia hispanica TaxID=49212 RepID=UPI002008F9B5|nr:ankyrin repeat-containing protein NPR4-like isoform X2 [Salvia hispanica]
MVKESIEKKLEEAASKGDITTLRELLQQDPILIHQLSFPYSRNLLHIATMSEQEAIVEEITRRYPQLARNPDSQKSSPLHMAAARGSLGIAARLITVALEMCWWRDDQGMNPVHVAAVKGHVEMVKELLRVDSFPAMERVRRGQTVLHLCVKHRQIEALKVLADKLGDLVCAKDDDGDTLLHLAVRSNQLEIIQYLVRSNKIQKLTLNSMGKTALDILEESPRDTTNYMEMKKMLTSLSTQSLLDALPKLTDTTMVVVVLIATMAFQAAISPPGGVWQGDTPSHKAGEAVMASTHPKVYKDFVRANTTAFISSLVTIVLITTGLPSENIYLYIIVLYAMWVSLASIAVSYGAAITVISSNRKAQSLAKVINVVNSVSNSVNGFISMYGVVRQMYLSWKSKKRRQQDLTADNFILRGFYWIFELSDRRSGDFIPRWFPRSASPPPENF